MNFESLKFYEKKIIRVFYKTISCVTKIVDGVLLYSNKGVTIFDGNGYKGYDGRTYDNFVIIYDSNNVIPFDNVESISYTTDSFRSIEEFIKSNYNVDYNKILNVLSTEFCKNSVFNTISDNIKILNLSNYPHKCPLCGQPAYIGISNVDCSRCPGIW